MLSRVVTRVTSLYTIMWKAIALAFTLLLAMTLLNGVQAQYFTNVSKSIPRPGRSALEPDGEEFST